MTVNQAARDLGLSSSNKIVNIPSTYTQSRYNGKIQTTVDNIKGSLSYSYSYDSMRMGIGPFNITTRIKHGISEADNIKFRNFETAQVHWVPFNTSRYYGEGKVANTNKNGKNLNSATGPQNIRSMVEHISTCTGGSWQSDSSAHWKQCSTCGYVASGRENHNWSTTSNSTCTTAGSRRCTTCGRTETISALGHSWNNAWTSNGSNHWHVCTRCNTIKDNTAHNWTTIKNATCTETGIKKCTVCGYTTSIAAVGHNWDNNTWQKDGNNHWHKCTRCGATKDVAAHNWTYSNVNASTHDKTCTICSYRVSGEAHKFVNNKCACGRYNTVTVSFDLNKPIPVGGLLVDTNPSSVSDITYTYADKYYDAKYNLKDPTLTDYNFLGWYTAPTGGTKITTETQVVNTNKHTLYAQWAAQKLPITELKGDNIYVIENNGEDETTYRKNHTPDINLPYSDIQTVVIPNADIKGYYQCTWESKMPDGNWEPFNLNNVSVNKNNITIKNANRDINGSQIRLTIRNNAGEKDSV